MGVDWLTIAYMMSKDIRDIVLCWRIPRNYGHSTVFPTRKKSAFWSICCSYLRTFVCKTCVSDDQLSYSNCSMHIPPSLHLGNRTNIRTDDGVGGKYVYVSYEWEVCGSMRK